MSVWRHDQHTRISDSGYGVLGVWIPFCGGGGFETYGGGILVVVEGDAAIPGVSGPQPGVSPGCRGVKNRLDGHKFAKLPHKTTVFVRTACRSSPHCFSCLRALPICLPRSL